MTGTTTLIPTRLAPESLLQGPIRLTSDSLESCTVIFRLVPILVLLKARLLFLLRLLLGIVRGNPHFLFINAKRRTLLGLCQQYKALAPKLSVVIVKISLLFYHMSG